jgi:uncharacterized sulfatase
MREYLASIASIDRNLGRLLAKLDELGVADRTVVILTSDHGYNMGHHGLWSKGNALWALQKTPAQQWPHIPANRRPNMFDTSLKAPLVIRWPGVVRPGTTITRTVSNLDWFPTICDMAGAEVPAGTVLRGRSIVPLLRGESVEWNDDLYGEYNMLNGAQTGMRAYRTPQWKLMRDFKNPGRAELYNLVKDPGETVNLIDSEDAAVRQIISELDGKILEQMRRLGDPLAASAAQQLSTE